MTARVPRFAAWRLLLLAALVVPLVAAQASPTLERVRAAGSVRVCIWPDYYGITFRDARNQQLAGIDIDLSAELARRLGVKLVYVDTAFSTFIADLVADRCDVAMFAVGITPERQQHLRFTQPYLTSGIYGITTRGNRVVRTWDDIDQPGVRVAVQAGTFMQPVMARSLKRATLVVIVPPQTREQELESGRVDVFMTDFPYSRRLLEKADWLRLVSPPRSFNTVSYAYAVKPGDDEWLRQLDAFVAQIKRDGTLESAARRHGLAEIVTRE